MRISNVVARMDFLSFNITIVSMKREKNVFPSTGYVTGAFHVLMVQMSQSPVRNGFVHKTSSSVTTITALDYIHYAIISMTVEMLLMRVDVVMDATMNTSSVEVTIGQLLDIAIQRQNLDAVMGYVFLNLGIVT